MILYDFLCIQGVWGTDKPRKAKRFKFKVPMADKRMVDGAPMVAVPIDTGRRTEPLRDSLKLWLECGDIKEPFVPNGAGAVTTFSLWAHLCWGLMMDHELKESWGRGVPDDFRHANAVETSRDLQEVDQHRSRCPELPSQQQD